MKKNISFKKMVASGNDFIIIERSHPNVLEKKLPMLAKRICNMKYGIGADGMLLLEKSKKADIKMRVFNADGSEAQMCGNGARCVAFYLNAIHSKHETILKIETKAGIINSEVSETCVRINLTAPKNLKLDFPIKVNNRGLKVNFINTGVPHTVIFVEGLEKIDVDKLGREIRYHDQFKPAGTNVNFVEILNENSIKVRTYERGVEAETLACGTGSVASALITSCRFPISDSRRINVLTRSGEVLIIHFNKFKNKFSNVWLEGKAEIVFKGEIEI